RRISKRMTASLLAAPGRIQPGNLHIVNASDNIYLIPSFTETSPFTTDEVSFFRQPYRMMITLFFDRPDDGMPMLYEGVLLLQTSWNN
ncbi:MAG: hypothetical protein P8Z41_06755, partial [Anaerolineales bacterium]